MNAGHDCLSYLLVAPAARLGNKTRCTVGQILLDLTVRSGYEYIRNKDISVIKALRLQGLLGGSPVSNQQDHRD